MAKEKMFIDTSDYGVNTPVMVHSVDSCQGRRCVLHNPTDHHMRSWRWLMRTDKSMLIERICPHGINHPDPDSLYFFTDVAKYGGEGIGNHGCDGCCDPEREDKE